MLQRFQSITIRFIEIYIVAIKRLQSCLTHELVMKPEIHLRASDDHSINLYNQLTFALCYLWFDSLLGCCQQLDRSVDTRVRHTKVIDIWVRRTNEWQPRSSLIIFNLIHIYHTFIYKDEIIHISDVQMCLLWLVFTVIYAASVSYRPETEIFWTLIRHLKCDHN